MPSWPPLAVGLLLLLLGAAVLRRGVDQARLVSTLRRLAPTSIGAPRPDFRMVKGRLTGEPLLASPLQHRPCLYYFFRVLEPVPNKKPRTLATGKEWTIVDVRDETGVARVDAWSAVVASPRRHEQGFKGLTKIPEDLQTFFERAGIDEKHLARLQDFQVHEYTIEPGDEVYVTGTLRHEAGEKVLYRKKRRPLVVSADPEIGLARGLQHELWLYSALAPMLVVAGVALLVIAFA